MKRITNILLSLALVLTTTHCIFSRATTLENTQLDIVSYNVWFDNKTADVRFPKILNQLGGLNPDVVFLQEVTPAFIKYYENSEFAKDYYLSSTDNAKQSYGLAYFSRTRFEYTSVVRLNSQYGRTVFFALLRLSNNHALVLANVHLESGQYEGKVRREQINAIHHRHLPTFLEEVSDVYPTLKLQGILWGGDLNIDGNEQHETLSKHWSDIAALKNKSNEFTYDVKANLLAKQTSGWFENSSRLDRFYIKHGALFSVKGYDVLSALNGQSNQLSDHYPVHIQLLIP